MFDSIYFIEVLLPITIMDFLIEYLIILTNLIISLYMIYAMWI